MEPSLADELISIVIADSDEHTINILLTRLQTDQCRIATTAEQLHEQIRTQTPDVVILDPLLPGLEDAVTFVADQQRSVADPRVVVVNHGDPAEIEALMSAGAYAVIDREHLDEDTLDERVGGAALHGRIQRIRELLMLFVERIASDPDGTVSQGTSLLAEMCLLRAALRVAQSRDDAERDEASAWLFDRAAIDFAVQRLGNTQEAADAVKMSYAELQQWLRDQDGAASH